MFEGSLGVMSLQGSPRPRKSTRYMTNYFIRSGRIRKKKQRRRQRGRQHKGKQAAQPQLQLPLAPQAPMITKVTALMALVHKTQTKSGLWVISRRATGTTWRSVTGMILSLMRGTTMTRMTLGEIFTFID